MNKTLTALAMIAITGTSIAGIEDAYDKTTDGQKIAWMDRGKDLVKEKLKDPTGCSLVGVL